MMASWRPLALAAALNVIVVVGVATAQTVIVTKAPPGATIELALNAATIGSAAADPGGRATFAVNLSAHGVETETAVRISVDVCNNLRRVLLVEPGSQPPLGEGCVRREIVGLYALRRVTTLVVEVAESGPAVWLRQGPVPTEWLAQEPESLGSARTRRSAPTGLVLFGGGSLAQFRDAVDVACGNVSECSGDGFRRAYTAGVAYWFTRFLAAEASYAKPAKVTANGSGDTYGFNSFLDARILTVAGKAGVPIGPVRFFGQAGANYHQATSSTTETIDDVTVTIDDVTQTIAGGTQIFEMKTAGWGWLFGGGVEVWVSRSLAVYAEGRYARVKGLVVGGGEGGIDDRATLVLLGVRVHIGR